MIGYVTLGTNDLEKAGAFYDALLAELGATRLMQNERMIGWGIQPGQTMLGVFIPFDQQAATTGNGTMVALDAGSNETVDKIHARAMELGAQNEGDAGPRGDGGFYGAYFRDLDGNKFAAFCMSS